ncbi:hypothetical protein HII36_13590 [Nonomuraea sp. NN258]|uniref:hypothetical protein n=1 Tax=Nonomuraea antri TaxID=2730852 RepID=UPI001569E1B6|nr:hypothetical protein [Nonomuraea antri]NRQ32866.1 hypothetical protein [Nonomuraea antri]
MISSKQEDRLILRPLVITRIANLMGPILIIPMLTLGVFGGALPAMNITPSPAGEWVLTVLFGLCCLSVPVMAVRVWRFAVICLPDQVIVRGYLCSRTVPIARVIDVDANSVLRWRDTDRAHRRTPIRAFQLPHKVITPVREHAQKSLERLSEWIQEHRERAG